ncbi:unnamed protein product [Rhodiola kirilowii]
MKEDLVCVVCGKISSKRCILCKAVRCSMINCQIEHWNTGHIENCNKFAFADGYQNSTAQKKLKQGLFRMAEDSVCVVCGETASRTCPMCKAAPYCTIQCEVEHWKTGHKENCTKVAVANSDQNSTAQKQLKQTLFPYDEFLKLYDWNHPVVVPPCGLLNSGNSCFANVVLQCLTYTKPLVAYLIEKGHQMKCKKAEWCFLCEFEAHVDIACNTSKAFSPYNVVTRLPHIGGNLGFGNQEDAHELLRFAIDSMQSGFLSQFGGEKALHPSSLETTLIQYIFGGQLLSQVCCTSCKRISKRLENMMDLTVEIHGNNASLEECLEQFTIPEWLDGDNMYKCDGCNEYVLAWKRLSVQQAPNVLTIALKRFQSGSFGKLDKSVTFPETLDLGPYMTNAVDDTDVYSLYAVVVHIGMRNASHCGHYICYIKNFHGNWYLIDDSQVIRVALNEVLSEPAYMLLYSRKSPRKSSEMTSEPSKRPEPFEKLESSSTLIQNVAIAASNSASSTCGEDPPDPFSSDDEDSETNDGVTIKDDTRVHEICGTPSLPPSKGTEAYGNGNSNHEYDSCLQPFRQTELDINEQSDSSTHMDSETYDIGHNKLDSATSPVLGKRHRSRRHRSSSCKSSFTAASPSNHSQGLPEEHINDDSDPMEIHDASPSNHSQRLPEEHINDVSDPMEIHGVVGLVDKEINDGNTTGTDRGHSDVPEAQHCPDDDNLPCNRNSSPDSTEGIHVNLEVECSSENDSDIISTDPSLRCYQDTSTS